MARRSFAALAALSMLLLAVYPGNADDREPQIEDPAGDHPVPFMDLTAVTLALAATKSGPALEVSFTLSGAVSPESRASMTGYNFTAKVGNCDLLVRFIGYPDGVFSSNGFASSMCSAGGRDAGGSYTITDNTVTVLAPLRDLRGVSAGQTMTDLRAFTSPAEGMYHDDTTAPSAAGDAASSDKPWTIA
ncbi:MAG: hypothetical protein KY395_01735 [Actinobacteria bacterium]|nr:hypothetical protein [Actinomycetota bacterium]